MVAVGGLVAPVCVVLAELVELPHTMWLTLVLPVAPELVEGEVPPRLPTTTVLTLEMEPLAVGGMFCLSSLTPIRSS